MGGTLIVIYNWIKLPLFDSWDYDYTTVIEDTSYTLRIYYSDRTETWSMEIALEEGDNLLQGEVLLPYKATASHRIRNLTGFFWLEPISLDDNETFLHPSLLYKYFNLYYIYLPEEE